MIFNPRQTHVVPTVMLLAAAALPISPLWTLGAYGDTETSSSNMFKAGVWGEELPVQPALFSLMLDEPGQAVIEGGEVAGTSTEQTLPEEPVEPEPVVEVSEPIVEITTPDAPEETPPGTEEAEVPEGTEEAPITEEAPAEPAPQEPASADTTPVSSDQLQ